MRSVVYGVGISLDGYIARPDGAVDFLVMPKDYSMAAFMKSIDTLIMGRKTFDVALAIGRMRYSYWKNRRSSVCRSTACDPPVTSNGAGASANFSASAIGANAFR